LLFRYSNKYIFTGIGQPSLWTVRCAQRLQPVDNTQAVDHRPQPLTTRRLPELGSLDNALRATAYGLCPHRQFGREGKAFFFGGLKRKAKGRKPNRRHKKGREPGKAFDLVLPSPLQEIRKVASQSYSPRRGGCKAQLLCLQVLTLFIVNMIIQLR
jgi:hypothetical protein